tara:strand:- start:1295 stop:1462 length:168 start_codon:yes stop_codon:yes gene_type:complete
MTFIMQLNIKEIIKLLNEIEIVETPTRPTRNASERPIIKLIEKINNDLENLKKII